MIDLLSKSLLTVFSVGVFVAGVYGMLYAITHVPTFTTIFIGACIRLLHAVY